MKKAKKKKTSEPGSFMSTIQNTDGSLRIIAEPYDPVVFETALIVCITFTGGNPHVPEQEALQMIYDTLIKQVDLKELSDLGYRLMHLQRGGEDALQ